jgi:hypothetical protein
MQGLAFGRKSVAIKLLMLGIFWCCVPASLHEIFTYERELVHSLFILFIRAGVPA